MSETIVHEAQKRAHKTCVFTPQDAQSVCIMTVR